MASSLGEGEEKEEEKPGKNKRISTRVFIIHPIHSTAFVPEMLFDSLVGTRRNLDGDEKADRDSTTTISQTQAISLLDRVELLPVHDLPLLTQAISQVSDAISKFHHQHRLYKEQQTSTDDNDKEDDHPPTTLCIIEGLDTMTENIIHNSNALRGSAVLTPALRTLTHLSRAHASFLSILLVNTTALGPSMPLPQQSRLSGENHLSSSSQNPNGEGVRAAATGTSSTGGLYSVFARDTAITRHHGHHQKRGRNETDNDDDDHQSEPLPLLHTLLSRTLDQGIDTHLLLQARRNQSLVEVIKDRTGNGLGMWCAWRQKPSQDLI